MHTEIDTPEFVTQGINLASAKLGAKAIDCSDDFFADKARLLLDAEPEFHKGRFDDHGQWMDGWESRRRRTGGHDWCLIELAVPGTILGFDINTAHFTGNYPPGASIEGSSSRDKPTEDQWITLLGEVALGGNAHHYFASNPHQEPIRWIRLNIYPDGGVARLKVYGQPVSQDAEKGATLELSALKLGGRVVAYSDAHYGNPEVILTPGRGANMGDGWETARRRTPGHEWIIIKLGVPGIVDYIEVDTAHYKGNFPAACSIQAASMPQLGKDALVTQAMFWDEILAYQPLSADNIHTFHINETSPVTHVKLNSIPDGGVSRFRVFGKVL